MEKKIMKFVNENKWFVVFFILWTFIHIIFLFNGEKDGDNYGFWPFNFDSQLIAYGWLEFFVYETLPLIIFAIVKLVGNDIKNAINEDN